MTDEEWQNIFMIRTKEKNFITYLRNESDEEDMDTRDCVRINAKYEPRDTEVHVTPQMAEQGYRQELRQVSLAPCT